VYRHSGHLCLLGAAAFNSNRRRIGAPVGVKGVFFTLLMMEKNDTEGPLVFRELYYIGAVF